MPLWQINMKGGPSMYNDPESLWRLFEKSGCITYYLLYKYLITQ